MTVHPQLLGAAEVQAALGVTRQGLAHLRRQPGFPEPVARLKASPIWTAEQIAAYSRDRPPRWRVGDAVTLATIGFTGEVVSVVPVRDPVVTIRAQGGAEVTMSASALALEGQRPPIVTYNAQRKGK